MYEHEIRFNDKDGQGEWCTIDRGYNAIAKDLPSGAYHEDVEDPGEFTWGHERIVARPRPRVRHQVPMLVERAELIGGVPAAEPAQPLPHSVQSVHDVS
jgi:hypothetical protein